MQKESVKIEIDKRKRFTFIEFLFIAYFSALACNDGRIVLYGGYILLAGFIICDKLLSRDRLKLEFPKACKFLYYFTVFCYFSRIWAWDKDSIDVYCKFLIPILILVVICCNYFIKIQDVKAGISAIALSGLVLSVYVIAENGGLGNYMELSKMGGNRLTAGGVNSNQVGILCAFSAVTLFYYALHRKKKICYVAMIIPLITSVSSGSKKSILIMLVGVFFLIMFSQKDRKGVVKYLKLVMLLSIMALVIRFVFSLEIMNTVKERYQMFFDTFWGSSINTKGSTFLRKRMIECGIEQFKKTPFLGIGFGNARYLNWRQLRIFTYSHNDFIEHLVNGGIVGFLLYYGTVYYLAVRHIKLLKFYKSPEIIISFIYIILYCVTSATSVTYYNEPSTYLYFILWISTVEVFERKLRMKKMEESEALLR